MMNEGALQQVRSCRLKSRPASPHARLAEDLRNLTATQQIMQEFQGSASLAWSVPALPAYLEASPVQMSHHKRAAIALEALQRC